MIGNGKQRIRLHSPAWGAEVLAVYGLTIADTLAAPRINNRHGRHQWRDRPLVAIRIGEEPQYYANADAVALVGYEPHNIYRAIRRGTRYTGRYWRFAD
jgi:hypothetical protein